MKLYLIQKKYPGKPLKYQKVTKAKMEELVKKWKRGKFDMTVYEIEKFKHLSDVRGVNGEGVE